MHRLVLSVALPAALFLALIVPGTVIGFDLTGCTLSLTSLDAGGATISEGVGGNPNDSTQQNPFIVDWNGSVAYKGETNAVIKDNSYEVKAYGLPTPIKGGSPNGDGNTKGSNTLGVSANAPFRITGLFEVEGTLKGTGGECHGSGWFKIIGDPVGTIPFFVGLGLLIVGALLVVGAIAGSALAGFVGGILLGLGAAVMLVIYSVPLVGQYTPLAALGAGVIAAVALTFVGRARGKGKMAASPV